MPPSWAQHRFWYTTGGKQAFSVTYCLVQVLCGCILGAGGEAVPNLLLLTTPRPPPPTLAHHTQMKCK